MMICPRCKNEVDKLFGSSEHYKHGVCEGCVWDMKNEDGETE